MDNGGPRGIPPGGVTLLLTPDDYFFFNVRSPNTLIRGSLGVLDQQGKATATVNVPSLPPAVIGIRFYHAYVAWGSGVEYASTPVPLTLTK